MSVSSFDLLPTLYEYTDLLFSTDQRCQSSWLSNLQSIVDTTCSENSVYMKRLRHTSEGLYSQVLVREIALHQAMSCLTDHERIRLSEPLNSRRNIRRFPEC